MNQTEYKALFTDESVSHVERSLYLYLRWQMDWDTGVVGGPAKRISYQAIREHIRYIPPAQSSDKPFEPNQHKIKRLLNKLIGRGWIEPLHDRNKGKVYMIFHLVLAVPKQVRADSQRHRNDTGVPLKNVTELMAYRKEANQKEAHSATHHITSKEIDIYTREALIFDGQFKMMAQQAKLGWDDVKLGALFEQFKASTKDDGSSKDLGQWLKIWRSYCVNVYANNVIKGDDNAKRGGFGSSAGEQFEQSRRAAEFCVESGIDGSALDEAVETYQFVRGNAKT